MSHILDASSIFSFLALVLLLCRAKPLPCLALINTIVESSLTPGHNVAIQGYLTMQYNYLVTGSLGFSPDILLELSPGNKFSVDLYGNTPSTESPTKSMFEPAADSRGPTNCGRCMGDNAGEVYREHKDGRGKEDA